MNLNVASWNLRGLNNAEKLEEAGAECNRYKIELLAIQETKMVKEEEKDLDSGYKFINLPQKRGSHGGLGFMIRGSFTQYVQGYNRISDRVGIIDIKLDNKPGNTHIRVLNVYGPTLEKSLKNPNLVE